MDWMNLTESLFRWLHVVFGVLWIGHLYFLNWVNANFTPTMDTETKRKVIPELMPRVLYWFRFGAIVTWITGILLLGMVYHMNRAAMFGADGRWGFGAGVLTILTFASPLIYDRLFTGALKDPLPSFVGGLIAVTLFAYLFTYWGGFTYRATAIHLGTAFGTIMAYNVLFKIWPAQRQIITSTKAGDPPDAQLVAAAGLRSRHNAYMSVPLLFTMTAQHSTWAASSPLMLVLVVAIGWGLVSHIFSRARAVKGF